MVMVTGGAYQGKTAYAMRKFGLAENDVADGSAASREALKNARCISNYQELVRRLGDDSIAFTEELCRCNRKAVVIMDEIGCGIVPVDKSERVWRENVGRCGCIIAANSDTVVRMVCGIPAVIKGDKGDKS